MELFRQSIAEFGIPSRVRSDKGGENVLVCQFMVAHRGPGRGSHIAGSSVHNQRIERLWRVLCPAFGSPFAPPIRPPPIESIRDITGAEKKIKKPAAFK